MNAQEKQKQQAGKQNSLSFDKLQRITFPSNMLY